METQEVTMKPIIMNEQNNPKTTANILAWYKFNSDFKDYSGHGYNITVSDIETSFVEGHNGIYCLRLKNYDDRPPYNHLSVPFTISIGNFSICLWIKDALKYVSPNIPSLTIYSGIDSTSGLDLYLVSNEYSMSTKYDEGSSTFSNTHKISITDSIWNHICFTFDYSNNIIKYYKDGNFINSKTLGSTEWNPSTYASNIYILNGSYYYYYNVMDYRVYEGILTQDEIYSVYKYIG